MSITLARLKEIPEEHFYPIVEQMIHQIYHASPHEVKRIYHLLDQFTEGPPGRIFIETALNSRKKVLIKIRPNSFRQPSKSSFFKNFHIFSSMKNWFKPKEEQAKDRKDKDKYKEKNQYQKPTHSNVHQTNKNMKIHSLKPQQTDPTLQPLLPIEKDHQPQNLLSQQATNKKTKNR